MNFGILYLLKALNLKGTKYSSSASSPSFGYFYSFLHISKNSPLNGIKKESSMMLGDVKSVNKPVVVRTQVI